MGTKADVWQGTLALMVLKTLERTGSLHGYGIARRIEQTSAQLVSVNYGTLLLALVGSVVGLLLAFGVKDSLRTLMPDLKEVSSVARGGTGGGDALR